MFTGQAMAAEVVTVPHGVIVTPDSGPARQVRVIAYGDAAFRVTALPVAGFDIPESLMVVAKPSGKPDVPTAKGVVTL